MSDILCVTNRHLCPDDFLMKLSAIAAARPAGIILREKDLTEREYESLARQVLRLCRENHVLCILHSFVGTARELGAEAIHLPLPLLRDMSDEQKACFRIVGASCHSVEEALEAQSLGCTYITVGHIFETDCKGGLPGRGVNFLQCVCETVNIPVYAIGGISRDNIALVRGTGVCGACVMSGLMRCKDPLRYLQSLKADE